MDNNKRKQIKNWMIANKSNYIDECGEFELTHIAEDAMAEFDIEDDEVFEISFEVSET